MITMEDLKRFEELHDKKRNETLSEQEQKEYEALVDKIGGND